MNKIFLILFIFVASLYTESSAMDLSSCLAELSTLSNEFSIQERRGSDVYLRFGSDASTVIQGPTSVIPTPQKIGKYEIVERIGNGAYGVAYVAKDSKGGLVVIKVVSPPAGYGVLRRDFIQATQHEAVIQDRVYAEQEKRKGPKVFLKVKYGEPEGATLGNAYLIMPFVPAKSGTTISAPTLADILSYNPVLATDVERAKYEMVLNGKTLTTRQRSELWEQYVEGLKILHATGVVHSDLKPANILVYQKGMNPDGTAALGLKIIDMGYAVDFGKRPILTPEGFVWGTPEYIHPNQWITDRYSAHYEQDHYASNVIYQELFLGRSFSDSSITFVRQVNPLDASAKFRVFRPLKLSEIPKPDFIEHTIVNTTGIAETMVERVEFERLSKLNDKSLFYKAIKTKLQEIRSRSHTLDFSPSRKIAELILSHEGLVEAQAEGKLLTSKEELRELVRAVMEITAEIDAIPKDSIGVAATNPYLLVDEFIAKVYKPLVAAGKISGDPATYFTQSDFIIRLEKFRVHR